MKILTKNKSINIMKKIEIKIVKMLENHFSQNSRAQHIYKNTAMRLQKYETYSQKPCEMIKIKGRYI